MVQSRKEPTISSADLSAPLDDDSPGRSRGTKPASSNSAASKAGSKPAPSGGSGLAMVALVLACLGVLGGCYAGWQLLEVNKQLADANSRLLGLEQQLTLTGDESTQSLAALQANLKQAGKKIDTNESEIRKLWDTRNVNKRAIADNTDALAASTKAQAAELKSLQDKLAALDKSLTSVNQKLTPLSNSVGDHAQELAGLKKQLTSLDKAAKQLSTLESLNSRVRSNEEAIEAIDAYRLNINRQLVELQQKLAPTP